MSITDWILAIIATEALTELLISAEITVQLRTYASKINPGFLGKLFGCGYCMSVWSAGAILTLFVCGNVGSMLILSTDNYTKFVGVVLSLLKYLVYLLVVHRLSNVFHECISRMLNRIPFTLVFNHVKTEYKEQDDEQSTIE